MRSSKKKMKFTNTGFWYSQGKGKHFPLFSIVLQNLLISLELFNQFLWSFQQHATFRIPDSTKKCYMHNCRLILLDRLTYGVNNKFYQGVIFLLKFQWLYRRSALGHPFRSTYLPTEYRSNDIAKIFFFFFFFHFSVLDQRPIQEYLFTHRAQKQCQRFG